MARKPWPPGMQPPGRTPPGNTEEDELAHRVCHRNCFDRYFVFDIPEGDLSPAEFEHLLTLVGDRDALVTKFTDLRDRGLLGVSLDRLDTYKQTIDIAHARPFITALCDIGDQLPKDSNFFLISADAHVARIIHGYLKKEPDQNMRAAILKDAFLNSQGIYVPVFITSQEHPSKAKDFDPPETLLTEDAANDLRPVALKKIQHAANSGVLKHHPHMPYLLYRWKEWGDPAETKGWVENSVESTPGAARFVVAFTQKVSSAQAGDAVGRTEWRPVPKEMQDFTNVDALETKLASADLMTLSDHDRKCVEAFLKVMEWKKSRKAGRQPMDLDF